MGEFNPINTQEELDKILGERLKREREKFADYEAIKKGNTDLTAELDKLKKEAEINASNKADFEKQIKELTSKIKGYEADSAKNRIALEVGLPLEIAKRLSGSNEDEWRQDAELLAKFISKPLPQATSEQKEYSGKNQAYKELLDKLN